MKTWHWIAFFIIVVMLQIMVPDSWSRYLGWVFIFLIASYLGGKIDELAYRISKIEGRIAAHDYAIEKLRKELLVDIPRRLFEIEKRL